MGAPMLVGAGLGAITSAAMGKSPFTGALLGGATGGAFGGAGGFGSGFTQGGLASSLGLGSAAPTAAASTAGGWVPEAVVSATPAAGSVAPNILGTPTLNSSLLGGTVASPMATAANLGGMLPAQTMMDKFGNYITNMPSNFMDYAKTNPLSTAQLATNLLSSQPQQMIQPTAAPIRPSTYQQQISETPTAAATNVPPSIVPTQKNKVGMVDLNTLIRKNPRAAQFAQSLIG